ncbi:MAG: SDR family oxidoreductase [Myxococcales bacterium]|nr:SDR family oxidoreductase [Myxococcales bacterium]MDH3484251.1 SDR family oxidoreductase [Myxococcales bacterium]
MTERVLIAGCGEVGNALGARLLADGYEVWGIRRNVSALAEGIRPWPVDLTDPRSLRSPPTLFDYVFYTASADRRDESSYRAVYVNGLRDLLGALEAAGSPMKRVFFTSSTAVYGQQTGEWVDERSVTEPARFNGRILLEAESLVRGLGPGVVVRLSGIYGPGRTRLIGKVWSGEAEATERWTNRVHVEDCGGLLHHLMRLDTPAHVYLGSDDAPATTAEVVTWMSEQLGVAAPPAADTPSSNKRCRNRLLRDTGYQFLYPTFREGYAPIIKDFLRDLR